MAVENAPHRLLRLERCDCAGRRKYNLVVASYSLGDLENAAEQRRALKALWQATEDVLVLIEPGTPSGSALIRAARAQVRPVGARTASNTPAWTGQRNTKLQVLEWETSADGARSSYIVAPCPHDGRCPMDGTRSWCHFSQKFERTKLQRHAKLRPDKSLPLAHQDERFSYVVIRRGQRPVKTRDVVLEEHLNWCDHNWFLMVDCS